MTIDVRYITATDLSPYLVDKTSGMPLANGVVSFWQDDSRTTPKLVYQLTGAPPNYTYTPLPNPIILSNTGTLQDSSGNNIAVYYFPYDSTAPDAAVQLYYITVTDSLGATQFTREAWPNIATNESVTLTQANISNQLTNPQFAQVLFDASNALHITVAGAGTKNVNIAPGWILNIISTGASSITVTRNSIAGSAAYPSNPPYTLTVTPGANITSLIFSQRLYNNPNIWSPQNGGLNGYIASSILLAPLSSIEMRYAPSVGIAQGLLTATNNLGVYSEYRNTIQLATASNTDNSDVGYVDIMLVLANGAATTFSNVQIVGLETNEQNVTYDQTPVNRQIDYMFHYYNPLLQYKPISSYLIGWDFPLNPAQFLGSTVAAQAVGANKSFYAWDQTIVFQTITSGVSISRGGNGEFVLTAAVANVQAAIIQYLDGATVREMLNSKMSSAIESKTSNNTGIQATISLWYCTDASLPSVVASTNNSIVATIDANGKPATFNGTWVEVPMGTLGKAQFTVKTNGTTNFNLNGFNGWDMQGAAATQSANFFAIVVGFGTMNINDTISINSVSVVPGDIPTRPAPQSLGAVINECQYYYEKSFNINVVPATAVGLNNGETYSQAAYTSAFLFYIMFKSIKRSNNPFLILYNPVNNNNQVYDVTTSSDYTSSAPTDKSGQWGFYILAVATPPAPHAWGDLITVNWTADARLGIV